MLRLSLQQPPREILTIVEKVIREPVLVTGGPASQAEPQVCHVACPRGGGGALSGVVWGAVWALALETPPPPGRPAYAQPLSP